jgi:hypothetical protein
MSNLRDLGLDYESAVHGIQSAIRFEFERMLEQAALSGQVQEKLLAQFKHLRTGIDASKADQQGLATLLINKGVFTLEEYIEHMRLGVNEELARYTAHCIKEYGLPPQTSFR